MSRAERERWQLGTERWPALQSLFADKIGKRLSGERTGLVDAIDTTIAGLSLECRVQLAAEYADWTAYFAARYDEGRFLSDGFGVVDCRRLPEREGQARMKLLYDALAASIRKELGKEWKP